MLESMGKFRRPVLTVGGVVAVVAFMWVATIPEREQERHTVRDVVTGAVESVRVTAGTEVTEERQGGSSTGGAVVGALIAGPSGAVIGSAAGSNPASATRVNSAVRGCLLRVRIPGHLLTSVYVLDDNNVSESRAAVVRCTLVRPGDRLIVSLATYQGRTNYTVNLP